MTDWKKPAFTEICMNAEIGAYQPDTEDPRDAPPLVVPNEAGPADASSPANRHGE